MFTVGVPILLLTSTGQTNKISPNLTIEHSVTGGNAFLTQSLPSFLYKIQTPQVLGDIVATFPLDKEFVDKLAMCESGKRDDIRIVDSNGLYSYGRFQYQRATFISKVKQYGLMPNAEDEEIMNNIYDKNIQTKLTIQILKEKFGYRNWLNCTIKILTNEP